MISKTHTKAKPSQPYVVHGVAFESRKAYIDKRRRYRRALRAQMESSKRGERS